MEEEKNKNSRENSSSATFKAGAVSLAFIIIGYQAALFVNRAAVMRIEANRDKPDTVFIYKEIRPYSEAPADRRLAGEAGRKDEAVQEKATEKRSYSQHSQRVMEVRGRSMKVESFRFNPNTAHLEDLMRLGFSQKQAAAIINYRDKGGKFRRKSDFAKSFVVSDSIYKRLEPYIDIPKVDINQADSATFNALPGIGPYYAAMMVNYREEIGGYSFPEQLLDIYNFGQERFDGLKDLVTCGSRAESPQSTKPGSEPEAGLIVLGDD